MGVKLFLKGEHCLSQKCPIVRRPYPPGGRRKKRRRTVSEYGNELKEKQKLRKMYNLKEAQFLKYVKEALFPGRKIEEDASVLLVKILESRLDNVIFRLGFASSRAQARQLVSHGHFLVNEKSVNIPSYRTKRGDIIRIKPQRLKKNIFQNLSSKLKKQKIPSWLALDDKNLEAKITKEPFLEDAVLPVEISVIFEYYSR